MQVRLKAIVISKLISPLLVVVAFFPSSVAILLAQTSLDDVHVMPLAKAAGASIAYASIPLVPSSSPYVIRKDVDLVLVPVTVTDPEQRLVAGLSRDNFQLFDGRKPQDIRVFSSEDMPLSVGIIVDTSGSMNDKMDRVREAVSQFCESANLEDEFFMITFGDEPQLAQDFTTSFDDIEKQMIYARPRGRTALLDAIYMGISKMREARYGKKALLIISDGGDNHSRYSEREIKAALREADVAVYAIGTFDHSVSTHEELLGPQLLSEITEPTGGRAYTISNISDLATVAYHIGTELRMQYVLGYKPSNVPQDKKWHKIRVRMRVPRRLAFLRAHAKTGYYARGNQAILSMPN
jgi:Ca-activated chloride channel family protein